MLKLFDLLEIFDFINKNINKAVELPGRMSCCSKITFSSKTQTSRSAYSSSSGHWQLTIVFEIYAKSTSRAYSKLCRTYEMELFTVKVNGWKPLTIFAKRSILDVLITPLYTRWKLSKFGTFSGLYFPVFGLRKEIYRASLHIHSEYKKIKTRKKPGFQTIWT